MTDERRPGSQKPSPFAEAVRFIKSLARELSVQPTPDDFDFTDQEKADYLQSLNNYKAMPAEVRARAYPQVKNEKDFAQWFITATLKQREKTKAAEQVGKEQEKKSLEVLQALFPDKKFMLFSDYGGGALIFSELQDNKRLYKVSRRGGGNDNYMRGEAQKMQRLAESGLAPHLYGYFEQDEREVIVMEKIDFHEEGVDTLRDDIKFQEMERISRILEAANLYPGDVEFVFDKQTKRIRIIDCGGLIPPGNMNESIRDRVQFLLFR
jgi:hypothetical protein